MTTKLYSSNLSGGAWKALRAYLRYVLPAYAQRTGLPVVDALAYCLRTGCP